MEIIFKNKFEMNVEQDMRKEKKFLKKKIDVKFISYPLLNFWIFSFQPKSLKSKPNIEVVPNGGGRKKYIFVYLFW